MANMLLGFNIFSDDAAATYSLGSWTVPLTNLKDPRPTAKARSSGLTLAATKFGVDLGSSKDFRALAITHTNLTSAAQYKITRYSGATFTTEIANTGWLPIPGYPLEDPDDIGAAIFHVFAAEVSARSILYEFDDTTNAAGFIEVGRNIVSSYWQPSINPDVGATETVVANTQRQNALGGTGYFQRRKPVRQFQFGFGYLDAATEAANIRRLRKVANLNKQVIIIPDPEDTANFNDRCFLGTLGEMPTLSLHAAGLIGGSGFQIVEAV